MTLKNIAIFTILTILFLGCAVKERTPKVINNIIHTNSIFEATYYSSKELLRSKHLKDESIIITSFVNLHKFKDSSNFGRVFSENLITQINKSGFKVVDFRNQKFVSINREGEFLLSRDASKLISNVKNRFALVGTYSKYGNGLLINMRILDNKNGTVITSSTVAIVNEHIQKLLEEDDAYPKYIDSTIKIIEDK